MWCGSWWATYLAFGDKAGTVIDKICAVHGWQSDSSDKYK
jgi:hypothetical protein